MPSNNLNEYDRDEYSGRYDFFRKAFTALKFNGIGGDYAEFGCCGAMTFCMAYNIMTKYPYDLGPFHLWAFDSFEGLPEAKVAEDAHRLWVKGTYYMGLDEFDRTCALRDVPRTAYTTVPGFYEQSLAPSAPGLRPTKIRLAYVDCDMYSSTKSVLQFLMPRLQHGMIIAFDDYYCCSPDLPSGERLAAGEIFGDGKAGWRLLPYVQFGWHGMSFVVEARGKLDGTYDRHW